MTEYSEIILKIIELENMYVNPSVMLRLLYDPHRTHRTELSSDDEVFDIIGDDKLVTDVFWWFMFKKMDTAYLESRRVQFLEDAINNYCKDRGVWILT